MGKELPKNNLKSQVIKLVDSFSDDLAALSLKIHDNPELGFQEKKASGWLTAILKKHGFEIEKGVGGLSTAFKAKYGSGSPAIALFAEYDALPEIGHACGHNIIAVSAVGAAIASKCAVDSCGGTLMVVGTPAEELFGGKITMLKEGVFEGINLAMIVHPGVKNVVAIEALACISLTIEFFGKAAHAAAYPEQGINALEAMILSFNGLNSLRQHIKDGSRIHGVIVKGGEVANIVPAYTKAEVLVRAATLNYLDELKEKVLNCFIGASIATGARLEYQWDDVCYAPMNNNKTLAMLFAGNLEALGRKIEPFEIHLGFGSTDMGNVSQIVPSIHPEVAIAPVGTLLHSQDFARAAASSEAARGITDAAKAMAMTIVDVLTNKSIIKKIEAEFYSGTP